MMQKSLTKLLVLNLFLFSIGVGLATFVAGPVWAEDKKEEDWKAPKRAAKKKNPISRDEKSLEIGKKFYVRECLSCHGEKGKGDGPAAKDLEKRPGDLSHPKMWKQTDGELFWKITEGKKPMPTYEKLLSEEERWHVVNFTRTLAPQPKE